MSSEMNVVYWRSVLARVLVEENRWWKEIIPTLRNLPQVNERKTVVMPKPERRCMVVCMVVPLGSTVLESRVGLAVPRNLEH